MQHGLTKPTITELDNMDYRTLKHWYGFSLGKSELEQEDRKRQEMKNRQRK